MFSPQPPAPSLYASLYLPPPADPGPLAAIAKGFSPRYEQHDAPGDLVSIDASGLNRLIGAPRVVGQELVRDAAAHGLRPRVALAATQTTAVVMAIARPGLTVVEPGGEAAALGPVPIGILEHFSDHNGQPQNTQSTQKTFDPKNSASSAISAVKRWGIRTLGEFAALPADDLVARLGRPGRRWQAIARGENIRPLVPAIADERFDGSLELEWPIDGLEPLSFVLTRLLEPLSIRLEQRDRGAAVLHVRLRLVAKEVHARRLQLPSPIRDVRTLRTLALLDLESHPPDAAVDAVTVVIDPTPGRVLQHTLFTRPHPTPDQISTLLARLGALMGQDRLGAAATLDSYCPGAFEMTPFKTEQEPNTAASATSCSGYARGQRPERVRPGGGAPGKVRNVGRTDSNHRDGERLLVSALRRCRQPVPARVVVEHDRPIRVTTDRRGFAGGAVTRCVGPWRTSGNWWERLRPASARWPCSASCGGQAMHALGRRSAKRDGGPAPVEKSWPGQAGGAGQENAAQPVPPVQPVPPFLPSWNRDEWDVALSDGAVYRVFRDRETGAWFIDGIVD